MSRAILIFPHDTSLIKIEELMSDKALLTYEQIIIKIIPKNCDNELYSIYSYHITDENIQHILSLYQTIYTALDKAISHKLLFNIELCYRNIHFIQNNKIPHLFVDYFYSHGDNYNEDFISQYKNNIHRIDFNYIYTENHNLNHLDIINTSLFDNYDIYTQEPLSRSYIKTYQQHNLLLNNHLCTETEDISFQQMLNSTSLPAIFYYQKEYFVLYLFNSQRYYNTYLTEPFILPMHEYKKKISSFLIKKMQKHKVCHDCAYHNTCFSVGFWLSNEHIQNKEQCLIAPILATT